MGIREAREDDATVLAALLGELGYPTEAADLPLRLGRLAAEAGAGQTNREAALELYLGAGFEEKPRRLLRMLEG